jgi:hypothetical protein
VHGLPMRLGENEVQGAIRGALEAYADRLGFNAQFFEPYANQQGAGARRFGADLLAILDNSRILMLEIKALHVPPYKLINFDSGQHADCCDLEAFGIPIAYAFNASETLAYYDANRPRSWPNDTLRAIHRAQPTQLPGEIPVRSHPSLFSWLDSRGGSDVGEQLGWLLGGGAARPRVLTNAVMALVYSADAKQLLSFNPKDTKALFSALTSSASYQERRASLFKGSDNAFTQLRPSGNADEDTSTNNNRPPPQGSRP